MNKAELASHVAAETSTTRAAAERMVGAVFSAIADALARDEPVAIAGFGKFAVRGRAARQSGTQSPNPGGGRRVGIEGAVVQAGEGPSRRGQRIALGQAATCSPSDSATRPPHLHALETQICKSRFWHHDGARRPLRRGPSHRSPTTLGWLRNDCGKKRWEDFRAFVTYANRRAVARRQWIPLTLQSLIRRDANRLLRQRCTQARSSRR